MPGDSLDSTGLGAALKDLRGGNEDLVGQRMLAGLRERVAAVAPVDLRVDRYIVLDRLGSGGMGTVFRAYDPKLDRRIALKVLDGGAPGEREARTLAQLNHPNVVTVHDVGEHDGTGYIAMELVDGESLSEWFGRGPHPVGKILDVFGQAGRGLAAAHAAGLVHRDFKPANVLLGKDGQARVVDFGVARTVGGGDTHPDERDADDHDETTTKGLVGTPAYMAPEQLNRAEVDSRTDQFAFCTTLFEALFGKRPFSGATLEALALHEVRLSWPGKPRVPRSVRRAIERGLSLERADRFATMDELLRALAAHARRNRTVATALGIGATLAVVGGGMFAWQQDRAERCRGAEDALARAWGPEQREAAERGLTSHGRTYAPETWKRVSTKLDRYGEAWATMHTETCEATAIRGEQSPAVMDLRMGCLRRANRALAAAGMVLAEGNAEVLDHADALADDLPDLTRCEDVEALRAEVPPPDDAEDAERVQAIRDQLTDAWAWQLAGDYERARTTLAEARTSARDVDYPPVDTELDVLAGVLHKDFGEFEKSADVLERALEAALRFGQFRVAYEAAAHLPGALGTALSRYDEARVYAGIARGLAARPELGPRYEAAVAHNFANVLRAQGKHADAEASIRHALEIRREVLTADDPELGLSRWTLASILAARGKYDEAEAEYRGAIDHLTAIFGEHHSHVAQLHAGLGRLLMYRGRNEAAEAEMRRAVELATSIYGPEHPFVTQARGGRARALSQLGRHAESESEYRAALEIAERVQGPKTRAVADTRSELSVALRRAGRHDAAEKEIRAALEIQVEVLGPEHPNVARSHSTLASALNRQGKYAEAEAEHRTALALKRAALGPDHPELASTHNNLGMVLENLGRVDEAIEQYREGLRVRELALEPGDPRLALSQSNLGITLFRAGKIEEARPLVEQAWAAVRDVKGDHELRASTALVLARIALPDRARARELAEAADDVCKDGELGEAEPCPEVAAFLSELSR